MRPTQKVIFRGGCREENLLGFDGFAAAFMTSCGGWGGSSAVSGASTGTGTGTVPGASGSAGTTASGAQVTNAAFTLAISPSTTFTTTSATNRSPQYVAPTTKTVYISLEDTPGHGNATFSFTEHVNSTNCTTSGGAESCTFNVQVPIGTDSFSILTTDTNNIPLGYATAGITVTSGGSNTLGPQGAVSPIIAKATSQYAFQAIPISNPISGPVVLTTVPTITATAFDADGDTLSLGFTGDAPLGDAYSSLTETESIGQFEAVVVAHGYYVGSKSAPEQTVSFGASAATTYLDMIGNGTTSAFTTTITTTTPAVTFTQTEFPQLPPGGLSVPASSTTLTLTCLFPTPMPTTDPCPGTASAAINLF
jgi:hypothetical protein